MEAVRLSTAPRGPEYRSAVKQAGLRLMPFLFACYVMNYIDRLNVGFAHLQMRDDLRFDDAVYGLGVGLFFIGYLLFEVPSNLLLEKIGARKTLMRIMMLWGLASICTMFVRTPMEFYAARMILGAAEAGFLPGMILYLSYWFPAEYRGRITAMFVAALPIAGIIGSPISGWIMSNMDQVQNLRAWQWLFLLEGIPSVLLGLAAFFYLDDKPESAKWLKPEERMALCRVIESERNEAERAKSLPSTLKAMRDPKFYVIALLGFGTYWSANAIAFWAPSILKSTGMTNATHVGFATAAISLAGLISMLVVGRSSDRRQERRWHAAISALLVAISLAVLPFFFDNATMAILVLMVAGIGHFAYVAVFWTIPPTYLSGSAAAGGIAAIGAISALGGASVPALLGWIRTTTGSLAIGMYSISFVLLLTITIMLIFIPAGALKRK